MKKQFIHYTVSAGVCILFYFFLYSCSGKIPEESLARYLNAADDYETGAFIKAKEEFAELAGKHPSFYQAAFMEGKSAFMSGNIEEAAGIFDRVRLRKPEYFDAAFWYARCLAQTGKLEEAEKEFTSLLSFNSQDPRIMYQLALINIEQEDIPEALSYLRKAGLFAEEFSRVFLHLGRLYYQFDMGGQALSELTLAESLLPAGHPLKPGIRGLIDTIREEKE